MLLTRRQWFAVSLLSVALAGCDPTQLLAPPIQQSSAASPQATVNAPSNLRIVASQTRLDLAWQDNSSNETGFEVRRSTDGASGSFPVIATTGANTIAYADTGLAAEKQYCYKVRAVSVTRKTTSYSVFTDIACATTPPLPVPPGPPNAPSTIGVGVGSDQVVVSWIDNSLNEDGFRLERATSEGTGWVVVGTTAANARSATDAGVASEVQVCYRVVAFNGEGDSPASNTACGTLVRGPTDLVIDSAGNLVWTDNSAIEDGYEVWWMDAFGIAYDGLMATLPPNTTSFPGGCSCYGFTVFAVKDGAYSEGATIHLPPAVPGNLTATADSTREVALSWTNELNNGGHTAAEFDIERCTGDASACSDADFQIVSFVTATTFRDVHVLPGANYTYRVRAWINVLYSDFSNLATATVP